MKQYLLIFTLFFSALMGCKPFKVDEAVDVFFNVSIAEAKLPVWIKGNTASDKFIIYINGGPGLTSIDIARADMFNWSDGLETDFAMVYYDQRGCGNAQGKIKPSDLTVNQYVQDLDAIVSTIKSKYKSAKIYLMGHSFGCFIGANYLLNPTLESKISGWISISGAYNFDHTVSWQYRRMFLANIANVEIIKGNEIAHWKSALKWVNATPIIENKTQKEQWRSYIGWPGEIIIPEEQSALSVRQYLGIGFASSYNVFPSYLSANLEVVNDHLNADAEGINLIGQTSNISLPSLFIWGKYDDLIVPQEGEALYKNWGTPVQHKFFTEMPYSSHEPFISDPENLKKAVIEFVHNH